VAIFSRSNFMRLPLIFLTSAFYLLAWQEEPSVLSPVDLRIAAARKQLDANAKAFQVYNELAAALCRKARDRDDPALYSEAKTAVDRSLELSPGNYDASKLRAAVLLGQREFSEALKLAQEINKRVPDDIAGWALLVDANAALGNYAEAERDCQWILDLRSGNALGFEKAAGLRELFGDSEGAVEFYGEALRRTAQSDLDQRAWLLTQKARVTLAAGNSKGAAAILGEAFGLFPNSQQATLVMAEVHAANGEYAEAAALFEKCYRAVPSAKNLYRWASALEQSGQKENATAQFAAFKTKARVAIDKPYNANLELVSYYADRKNDPAEALRIATLESARRQDSATLAALAWALYQNGKFVEAKTEMDKALAVGVREASYFCHAARISAKVNNAGDTARFEKELATFSGHTCGPEQPIQAFLGAAK
jgi:tetratricopeptide (TPR) repeat protein